MNAVVGRRRLAGVVVLLVAALLVGGLWTEQADARTRRRDAVLTMINQARRQRGLPALSLNVDLSRAAKHHSRDMAGEGYIFHTANLTDQLRPWNWQRGGENVGAGFSVDGLWDAFMASAPHRENILSRSYDHVGLGMIRQDGVLWMTMIFYG